MLLLADTAGLQGRSRLLVASQDLTSPPAATATGSNLGMSGLRETVTELEVLLPGDAQDTTFQPHIMYGVKFGQHEKTHA